MGKKVYAIQSGFDFVRNKKVENIIVNTWDECLKYVKGVKGAKYKSFADINEAKEYLNQGQNMLKKSAGNYPKDCLHVYVDGSYSVFEERYSYGLVAVKDEVVQYIEAGSGKSDPERNIRQIAGELKGAERAVEYAIEHKEKKLVIFHDYEGIAHHATGAWARKDTSSIEYYEKMQSLMKTGIEIIFVKVDSHTGDLFNELVDEKCKECLGIPSDNVVEKWLQNDKILAANSTVKEAILSIAPDNEDNIIVLGDDDIIPVEAKCDDNKICAKKEADNENDDMFKELVQLYIDDEENAKKKISKLLKKDQEKFIFYLLNSYVVK